MNDRPFFKASRLGSGVFCLLHLGLAVALVVSTSPALYALTDDGATEALTLRYHAELAIAQEARAGHRDLAGAMQDTLPHLLKEYLVTRDGTIALDTVDAAFVREQFKVARAMEEPGVALAMDIYAGEATGFEHDLQASLSKLADHHADVAERAQERASEHGMERVSDRVVDAYERQIERQLDKVEQNLEKANHLTDKLDAKLDAAAARLELKAERQAAKAEKAEAKTEEKAEAKAEKAEAKAEKAEPAPAPKKVEPKPEPKVEKAEAKAEKAEEKAEKKADKDKK